MTPEDEALDEVFVVTQIITTESMRRSGHQRAVDLIAAALPPAPPDPDACNWCQDGKHDRCQGHRKLEGDGPGQASGACHCRTPHPRRN